MSYPKERCNFRNHCGGQWRCWMFLLLGQQTPRKNSKCHKITYCKHSLCDQTPCNSVNTHYTHTHVYLAHSICSVCFSCAYLYRRLSCPWWQLHGVACSSSCHEHWGRPPDTATRTPPENNTQTYSFIWQTSKNIKSRVLFFPPTKPCACWSHLTPTREKDAQILHFRQ